MIVGSLVLILSAAGLLAGGLLIGSDWLLVGSIVSSLLAALVLYIGVRQTTTARGEARSDGHDGHAGWDDGRDGRGDPDAHPTAAREYAEAEAFEEPDGFPEPRGFDEQAHLAKQGRFDDLRREYESEGRHRQQPDQQDPAAAPAHEPDPPPAADADEGWVGGDLDEEDPEDEPPIQRRPARVAAAVARLETEVLVIDGRPRYHVAGCVHLLGREAEPLPAYEAVELGFHPCSLCEPDTVLTSGSPQTARH